MIFSLRGMPLAMVEVSYVTFRDLGCFTSAIFSECRYFLDLLLNLFIFLEFG